MERRRIPRRAWHGFLAAGALVNREIEQHLRREGPSRTQYETLVRSSAAPNGGRRTTDLADALYTSKTGLTYQVAQLEKAGFVRRAAARCDERGAVAVRTRAGRRRLEQVAPGHLATVRRALFDVLTPAR
ncbi:MarR family transcriptional regulator [Nocardia sp. NPDC050793]|uniref:MarR family winged helix-turn-helix transcriptional regulator n=1 Tax=Nocardia sp. NPDC050793 TaxID=3155159 RepID=UPI0033EB4551